MRRDDLPPERTFFRSEHRVFNLNGAWYFSTREGDRGPFINRKLAELEAVRYATERASLNGFQKSRETVQAASRVTLSIVPIDEPVAEGGLALEAD